VFLSPPWGGTGYHLLPEYSLSHIYPEFNKIISKSTEFSGNLMLFLPKNTSISELIQALLPYYQKLSDKENQLVLEIEELVFGISCKALLISTGKLAKIQPSEMMHLFIDQFCY
jgi:hypothetical protein